MAIENLIAELKRRRVFRVLVGYGVVSFAVLQIVEPIMHGLRWPDAVLGYVVVGLAVGFPVSVVLAWAFDVNAGRIERAPEPAPGATGLRGSRLALVLFGIGVVAAAPGLAWYFLRGQTHEQQGTAAGAKGLPSIAVLPFADLSPNHDQEYFSDGIAEEILHALTHVEGLKVIGRTSSFSFKGKSDDLKAIGEKLGVAHVLQGSLRKDGSQIRVAAQLVRAGDGSQVWSEKYDRKLAGIFHVQDEIAAAVAKALQAKLMGGGEAPRPVARTANLEAYRYYLLGLKLQSGWSEADTRASVAALEKATSLDPGYAAAWAKLSMSHWWLASGDAASAEARQAALEADRAIALAPDSPEAYQARAHVRSSFQGEFAGADSDSARAVALAPGDADFLSTRLSILRDQGRFAESVVAGTRGLEADPLSVACLNQLTFTYWFQGDLKRARASNDRAFEVSPDSRTARFNRCALDIAEGQEQAAREHCLALPKSVQPFYSALLAKKWGTPWRPRWPTSARAARGRSPSCMPFTARPTGPSIGSSGPSSATISKG